MFVIRIWKYIFCVMMTPHGDVIKSLHFPRCWPFVRGIHRSPVNSPHKGQLCGALICSLICAWINGWVSNREAGNLRRNHAHYDVAAMALYSPLGSSCNMADQCEDPVWRLCRSGCLNLVWWLRCARHWRKIGWINSCLDMKILYFIFDLIISQESLYF